MDDHPATPSSLGDPVELFKPMFANILAGAIFSVLFIGGGIAVIWFVMMISFAGSGQGDHADPYWPWWMLAGFGSFLGLVMIGVGIWLIRYARWLYSHEVELFENGFSYRSGGTAEEVNLASVASIRETILYERPPVLKGPAKLLLPKVTSKSYRITTKNGKEFGFNGTSIKRIRRFGELLRAQADRAGLPWETVEEHR